MTMPGASAEWARWERVLASLPAGAARDAPGQRRRAERCGARLVLAGEPAYPAQLAGVTAPPPYLFVRGALEPEDALAVAIVGSRRATAYGVGVAERLASELAARGVTIVSGLARGIDGAAHRGALQAGGRTLAVLGSGADVVYPPEHRRLAARVMERGALLSQFPMGTPALAHHFPARNRTIAGLALGTVVVEAAERSGALITAGHAGELGRDVFGVPGPVTADTSRGVHRLLQDGATLVQTWEDVVAELPEAWRRCLRAPARAAAPAGAPDADEARLLALVGAEPVHIDRLIEGSGMPSGRAAALLVDLELKGWVRRAPGQRYLRG
jgi:DNA processing protein